MGHLSLLTSNTARKVPRTYWYLLRAPTGRFIGSPYDSDARYATKRETHWIGYKLHLTETYGDDQPNLITSVETTHAAVADDAVTETIHASLAEHDLLPDIPVADTG